MKQYLTELCKTFWKWLVFWTWAILIMWTVYAFTTPLPQVSNWDSLTSTAWNDMVDAVNDEYTTSETLTNKIFLWKPVYRQVMSLWAKSATTHVIAHGISDIDEIINAQSFVKYGGEYYGNGSSYSGRRLWVWPTNLTIDLNVAFDDVKVILEYTKN